MKEYYKELNFYYILVPVLAIGWVLLAWLVSLPTVDKKWARNEKHFKDAQLQMARILALDPERLEYEQQKGASSEFDYGSAVEMFAKAWKIPTSNYSLNAGREIKRRGQLTQGASVSIKPVDVETFTQFLSAMMLRWPDLQVDQLKLTKQKDGPDSWKVDTKFTYYY
jgi:hypothetical protein